MNPKEKLESLQRDIKARAGRLRTEVEVKQGELKDQSFKVVLEFSESALNTVAEVVDKVAEEPATQLRKGVERIRTQQKALVTPPVEDYDSLNVKVITAKMGDLGAYDLKKIANYERAHKNRKTILREVDRRLAS